MVLPPTEPFAAASSAVSVPIVGCRASAGALTVFVKKNGSVDASAC